MCSGETTTYLFIIFNACIIFYVFGKYVFPFIAKKSTKIVEKNPNWITSRINDRYYGFYDVDFILVESLLEPLPKFRLSKDKHRIELLLPVDIQIRDLDEIAKLALIGKISVKYGLYFPNKPTQWLSILCYMLDGGEIKTEILPWKK